MKWIEDHPLETCLIIAGALALVSLVPWGVSELCKFIFGTDETEESKRQQERHDAGW